MPLGATGVCPFQIYLVVSKHHKMLTVGCYCQITSCMYKISLDKSLNPTATGHISIFLWSSFLPGQRSILKEILVTDIRNYCKVQKTQQLLKSAFIQNIFFPNFFSVFHDHDDD